jgi:hypothetical protein
MVGIIGDWAGQLEENEEYWMGRKESGLNEQTLECTDAYEIYGIPKLSSFVR